MDVAYDHIQKEALVPEDKKEQQQQDEQPAGLNAEFQEAFKAVSASPWGARLGGLLGQVRKQGESLYAEAQKEYATASEQANKGFTDLRSNIAQRARGISIQQPEDDGNAVSFSDPTFVLPASPTKTAAQPKIAAREGNADAETRSDAERPESLPADIVKEATSMVSAFRLQATTKLKDLQKAEDAADEALLKFGTNIRSFFRDAVTVTAPDESSATSKEVLFETNDAEGKRVFHSSRFEAQLHVIHSSPASFMENPESPEWEKWSTEFDVGKETDRIAADLDRFEELRRVMEKLVPEKVEYKDFWRRYYFLRKAVEEEEKRRKEVLKGAAAENEEDVDWGDDDEDSESSTPVNAVKEHPASQSTTTLTPHKPNEGADKSPRRSNEDDKKSTADSDASYDIVSGATSKTPSSPKESKKDESDEEDWE